ncbi:MAG: aminotransferase class I/II-fold pyridoxal phosphate-dependent enzyme [Chitinophagaceae bacterium]|nr:aminotransferase class I/II-fold pyridoxal phosphate-dependent enzyme [Chitinophagaceae bacterium]
MKITPDYPSMTSLAIHGNHTEYPEHAHLLPIFASSTFTFESAQQGMDRFSGKESGYMYSRFGNPTVRIAEQLVAGLEAFGITGEKGEPLELKALLHASGQSAMATMLLSNLSSGDTILSHPSLYGGTHEFIYGLLGRFGIHSLLSDLRDPVQLEALIKTTPRLKLIHIESPANPTMGCIDLAAVCAIAARHGVKVTVDNTFATPYLQQPFRYGADFVFHSTTKFLNGHGTSIGGVLIGKDIAFMNSVAYDTYKLLGANSNPFDAFLLTQGIKTLGLRMDKHCDNAEQVAAFLSGHQAVQQVHYNGLEGHADRAITQQQMRRAGAVLSFELKGGVRAGMQFIDKLQVCTRAVSVGTVDTLISHPASMSHSGMSPADRLKSGISDGLIRMSVGIEPIRDIIDDLNQAMEGLIY